MSNYFDISSLLVYHQRSFSQEEGRMIKRIFVLTIIFAVLSFYACKSDKKEELPKSGAADTATKSGRTASKRNGQREGREGQREGQRDQKRKDFVKSDLQLYSGTALITAIPPDQFNTLATKKLKAGKHNLEVSAILLSDLLNKHNLSGKSVTLSGPSESVSVPWEEAMDGQIYVCQGKESLFRIYDQDRKIRLPGQLTKIEVSQQVVAATPERERPERNSERQNQQDQQDQTD
jgi:hypothetical protein